jgi:hypothetical protein
LLTVLWMAFAGELVLGIFSYIMGIDTESWRTGPGGFTAHENTRKPGYELADAKQRLRQYKKRCAKHYQKHQYNIKHGLKTSTRTLKAIENNKKWVEHYHNQIKDLTDE